jgi:hypothetical protein
VSYDKPIAKSAAAEFDVASVLAEDSPLTSLATHQEAQPLHGKGHIHPHVKWHVDVLVDGHDVYQGYIREITIKGGDLFLPHNLQHSKQVKLHVHVPPLSDASPPRVLEMTARVLSSVYDSRADYFRAEIAFLAFTFESDKTYLQTRID